MVPGPMVCGDAGRCGDRMVSAGGVMVCDASGQCGDRTIDAGGAEWFSGRRSVFVRSARRQERSMQATLFPAVSLQEVRICDRNSPVP